MELVDLIREGDDGLSAVIRSRRVVKMVENEKKDPDDDDT